MTTTYATYKNGGKIQDLAVGKEAMPFDYGAENVDPISALDPSLVYDLAVEDYIGFLCALNYTDAQLAMSLFKFLFCFDWFNYTQNTSSSPISDLTKISSSIKESQTIKPPLLTGRRTHLSLPFDHSRRVQSFVLEGIEVAENVAVRTKMEILEVAT
ncbi:hypothetical protein NE237_003815 [Protea cynaroides]|uniref:Uncharacterized protein n=1 Tax=Protea cynaroides TaxID=273540 RepID=A0A9Q0KI52_9MAGN|nr:hypothetical protein NE237_003815 [Protea cynaroides]